MGSQPHTAHTPSHHYAHVRFLRLLQPHGGARPFHQKSTYLTQLTLGPYAVQIWSRNPRISEATKPSKSIEWLGFRVQGLGLRHTDAYIYMYIYIYIYILKYIFIYIYI